MKRIIIYSFLMIFLYTVAYSLTQVSTDSVILTNKTSFKEITGVFDPGTSIELYRNNKLLLYTNTNEDGEYGFNNIELIEGYNSLYIKSEGVTLNSLAISRDTSSPELTLLASKPGEKLSVYDQLFITVNTTEVVKEIFAQTPDNRMIKLKQNTKSANVYTLEWRVPDTVAYYVSSPLKISAVDMAGNWTENKLYIVNLTPRFIISSPSNDKTTSDDRVSVKGYADPGIAVIVNGNRCDVNGNGLFELSLKLSEGKNLIKLTASLPDGKIVEEKEIKIIREVAFKDIAQIKDKELQEDVKALSSLQIVPQSPEESFRPEEAITRAELATWLIKALGLKIPEVVEPFSKDVPVEYWRAAYIKLSIDYGFFSIDENGYFWPNQEVSKSEGDVIFKKFDQMTAEKATFYKVRDVIAKIISGGVAWAEEPEKVLTREDAARKLSTTSFIKKKIQTFLDWSEGFEKISGAGGAPEIKEVLIRPAKVKKNGYSIYTLEVQVYDPQGLSNIQGVLADLSEVGGIYSSTLVDNGKWGDKQANDGIFTLQSSIKTSAPDGERKIQVKASNRTGWVAVSTITLTIIN